MLSQLAGNLRAAPHARTAVELADHAGIARGFLPLKVQGDFFGNARHCLI